MKRFILLGLVVLFFGVGSVSAVSSTVTTTNCGIASDPKQNKCCYTRIPAIGLPNLGVPVLDVPLKVINGLIDGIAGPAINSTFKQILDPVNTPCTEGVPSTPGQVGSVNCICLPTPGKSNLDSLLGLCDRSSAAGEITSCKTCLSGGGIWTGLGCMQGDVQSFIQDTVLRMGIGIAGGISLLCIMFAAFQMQTSAGNAEKLKKAQELLTNCIMGLMVIIFSTLILKIIGVDILQIPGFK